MELEDRYRRDETDLSRMHVRSQQGGMVPLSAFATLTRGTGTMTVLHKSQLPAITFSFELAPGRSLSDATAAIDRAKREIGLLATMFGSYDGQMAVFEQSQTSQLWLIVVAIAVIYVILGVLYGSWLHPVTILMGIPSAAVGAFLALHLTGLDISFIAMIGVLLLIGIVKKNAIMMIDFALDAQRRHGTAAREAIHQACLLRFRPIMMTTLCAMMGAMPIALGLGAGAELRQPMGVVIVGGLLFSQVITLFNPGGLPVVRPAVAAVRGAASGARQRLIRHLRRDPRRSGFSRDGAFPSNFRGRVMRDPVRNDLHEVPIAAEAAPTPSPPETTLPGRSAWEGSHGRAGGRRKTEPPRAAAALPSEAARLDLAFEHFAGLAVDHQLDLARLRVVALDLGQAVLGLDLGDGQAFAGGAPFKFGDAQQAGVARRRRAGRAGGEREQRGGQEAGRDVLHLQSFIEAAIIGSPVVGAPR